LIIKLPIQMGSLLIPCSLYFNGLPHNWSTKQRKHWKFLNHWGRKKKKGQKQQKDWWNSFCMELAVDRFIARHMNNWKRNINHKFKRSEHFHMQPSMIKQINFHLWSYKTWLHTVSQRPLLYILLLKNSNMPSMFWGYIICYFCLLG
jgi:hypothetical protein